ncbi:unnamed protein product [Clonostachys rosea f. rosea IK726]|uniref:Uncharacterized protein n=1 Tax=Clonostachys rosea f. rosea IK726 TaxID=1349383 RepID=A0ACA9ULE5_BIOOC|nr:unnamed protein product [Clonostachys rosea f. rosea IK726]
MQMLFHPKRLMFTLAQVWIIRIPHFSQVVILLCEQPYEPAGESILFPRKCGAKLLFITLVEAVSPPHAAVNQPNVAIIEPILCNHPKQSCDESTWRLFEVQVSSLVLVIDPVGVKLKNEVLLRVVRTVNAFKEWQVVIDV